MTYVCNSSDEKVEISNLTLAKGLVGSEITLKGCPKKYVKNNAPILWHIFNSWDREFELIDKEGKTRAEGRL